MKTVNHTSAMAGFRTMVVSLSLIVGLTGVSCAGTGQRASRLGGSIDLVGKWEGIAGSETGEIFEFFPDGTVSVEGMAMNYSWPDANHLKLDASNGMGTAMLMEVELDGDKLILTMFDEPNTFVRYEEFKPSPERLAGSWSVALLRDNICFDTLLPEGANFYTMTFTTDGLFGIHCEPDIIYDGFNVEGPYRIEGDRLHIEASGTWAERSSSGHYSHDVAGEVDCMATMSHASLYLQDENGDKWKFDKEE